MRQWTQHSSTLEDHHTNLLDSSCNSNCLHTQQFLRQCFYNSALLYKFYKNSLGKIHLILKLFCFSSHSAAIAVHRNGFHSANLYLYKLWNRYISYYPLSAVTNLSENRNKGTVRGICVTLATRDRGRRIMSLRPLGL